MKASKPLDAIDTMYITDARLLLSDLDARLMFIYGRWSVVHDGVTIIEKKKWQDATLGAVDKLTTNKDLFIEQWLFNKRWSASKDVLI